MRLRADRSIPLPEPFLRLVLLGGGVLVLLAARFFPFSALPPLCAFKYLTGLPCLTCGMTRSWVHLVHGRVADAWAMSPLGLGLCLATVVALIYGAARMAGLPALRLDLSPAATWALRAFGILLVLLNWGWVVAAGRA